MAYSAAQLLVDTVESLSRRAPAIVAAAAHQLGEIVLSLHFGDGSHGELTAHHSRLRARVHRSQNPDVETYFDNRSLNLLFDLERRPVDQVLPASLDVRGSREQTLAVWRTFQLLSQRASGLRAIQAMWKEYREQYPEWWGRPAATTPGGNGKEAGAMQGLTRTLIANMLDGVTKGFEKVLEINGVGYRAEAKGSTLNLSLGYSHPVEYALPSGISAEVEKQTKITVRGIDKELVGATAAKIRSFREPEPYKGKGIKYADERILRKAGKTGKK